MKELTKYQKGKVVLGLIEDLSELPNKDILVVDKMAICGDEGEKKLILKIAERSGIKVTDYYPERGQVDIAEDISITLDDRVRDGQRKIEGEPRRKFSTREIDFNVSEELKLAAQQFEEKNIPPSGPCNTLLGEIFRAIQRIQYRAFNDGDICWDPGSPSFMSYIFLRSQVDMLNFSQAAYNEGTGEYKFEFTDPFLVEYSFDGRISDVVEDDLATTANFIKYQIMDLLLNGKIEDSPNEFDSRDCSSVKKESSWY